MYVGDCQVVYECVNAWMCDGNQHVRAFRRPTECRASQIARKMFAAIGGAPKGCKLWRPSCSSWIATFTSQRQSIVMQMTVRSRVRTNNVLVTPKHVYHPKILCVYVDSHFGVYTLVLIKEMYSAIPVSSMVAAEIDKY